MKGLPLRWKLYIIIMIMLIPMLLLEINRILEYFDYNLDQELQYSRDFANALEVSFTNYLERIWETELAIGLAIIESDQLKPDRIKHYMQELKANQPTIQHYSWIDTSGVIQISSVDLDENIIVADRDYVKEILAGKDKYLSNLLISRLNNKYTVVAARGIRVDGELVGIVSAAIDLQHLEKVLPTNRAVASSSFGLIDRNGYYVYRNGIPNIAQLQVKINATSPASKALLGNTIISKRYKSPINGKRYLGVDSIIEDIGWVSFANASYDAAVDTTLKNVRKDIIILSLITIICLILSLKMCSRIIDPISKLKRSAQEISKGNLNVRTDIHGQDELAAAGHAFDIMANSIEEYDRLKNQFFSNLSHELKTPLNIILAAVQLLDKSHEAFMCENYQKNSKYIGMLRQNCFRLLRLINNLIDITRIDAGYYKLTLENHNIVSIVEDIAMSVSRYIEHKNLQLVFDTDVEEKIVLCDPDKIERIVLNLLSNSIKFTKSGGYIFVSIFDKGDALLISVKDTGIGIPEDKLTMIFERFRQVDTSLSRENEGSGIGLSLVHSLVEAHGGKISVNSSIGVGSEFLIELPCSSSEPSDTPPLDTDNTGVDRVQKISIEFSDIYTI